MVLASWALIFSIQSGHFIYGNPRRGTVNIAGPLICLAPGPVDTMFSIVSGLKLQGKSTENSAYLEGPKPETVNKTLCYSVRAQM